MSYCHDIHLDSDFDRAAFVAAAKDIRTLIRRSESEVVGPSGRPNSLPIVEDFRIAYNGVNQNCICGSSEPERRPLCPRECRKYHRWGSDAGQPFVVDVSSTAYLSRLHKGYYWFDCKTGRKPYDKLVKMSMMALNPNPPKGACERPPEEAKGRTFESEIMVLNQKTCHRKGAPNRCYHVTTLTASKSPSTIPAW